jgi:hypothetical protein
VTPAGPGASSRRRSDRPARQKVLAGLAVAITLVVIVVVVMAVRGGGQGTPAALRPVLSRPGNNPATTSHAANPAAPPVVYSQVEGWHGGQVRPAAIYVGQGGSPYVTGLRWLSWTSAGAHATGYLHRQQPGCGRPVYQCPYRRFRVRVQLSRPATHGGTRFFARMRWAYSSEHVRYVIRWRADRGYWRSQGRPSSHSAQT